MLTLNDANLPEENTTCFIMFQATLNHHYVINLDATIFRRVFCIIPVYISSCVATHYLCVADPLAVVFPIVAKEADAEAFLRY